MTNVGWDLGKFWQLLAGRITMTNAMCAASDEARIWQVNHRATTTSTCPCTHTLCYRQTTTKPHQTVNTEHDHPLDCKYRDTVSWEHSLQGGQSCVTIIRSASSGGKQGAWRDQAQGRAKTGGGKKTDQNIQEVHKESELKAVLWEGESIEYRAEHHQKKLNVKEDLCNSKEEKKLIVILHH